MAPDLAGTADSIVRVVLGVRPGESILILTDADAARGVSRALTRAVEGAGGIPLLMTMPPLQVGGQEPPRAAAAALQAADAAILQGSCALFHTDAVRAALAAGRRTLDMWGVSEEMMAAGGMVADHAEVERLTRAVEAALAGADRIRLRTEAGTDLRLSLRGRPLHALAGGATRAGTHCALPAGEVAAAPVPGSAEGVVVDPYALERRDLAFRREAFRLEVAGGAVTRVEGGREARAVAAMIDGIGDSARNVAEFAVGTNRWCRLGASLREAKKAWGTAHIAIGDDMSLGGDVASPLHMDMVLREPTLHADGRLLIDRGRLLVEPPAGGSGRGVRFEARSNSTPV